MVKIFASVKRDPFHLSYIDKIIKAGAFGLRFNFSTQSIEKNINAIKSTKGLINQKNYNCKILADIPGNKVRVAPFYKEIPREVSHRTIHRGQIYKILAGEYNNKKQDEIVIKIDRLTKIMNIDDELIFSNGRAGLKVVDKLGDGFKALALNNSEIFFQGGVLSKRMNKYLSEIPENIEEIFSGLSVLKPDYISLSFIASLDQLLTYKNILKKYQLEHCKLLAKIETQEGVDNLDSFISELDGVIVARGDLHLTDDGLLGINQKKITQICKKHGVEVIIASSIMDSLNERYVPTASDISDLTNILLDGVDGILLTRTMTHLKDPEVNLGKVQTIIKKVKQSILTQ